MDKNLEKNLIQRVVVGDIFRRRAAGSPDMTAIEEKRGDHVISLSFKELNSQLNCFVRAIRGLGLEQGDRIGFLGLNSAEYIIALYGCAKGGFIAVPANPGMNPNDIAYILNHAEIKALIADDMLCPLVNAIKNNLPNVKHLISIQATGQKAEEPYIAFDRFLEGHSDEEIEDIIINDRNIFEILYTSGTTSKPKGVAISHLSVFISSLTTAIEIGITHGFIANLVMPIFHCAQQTMTTSVLHMGGKSVIFRGFDPALMLNAIEQSRINMIFCLPAMYRAMLDHPDINETDLSSVKKCIYAMAPMDQRTLEQGIETFRADFMLGTGQTECLPPTNIFRPEWQLKKKGNYWGSSCLTLDTAVMDDDGNKLTNGEIGEIVWRGPSAMETYLKNSEDTEKTREFGWHHSGDLGYIDEDGLLAFVDRKKDMIKTGGENVASVKVEQVILNDRRVASVAVIGLPHERWTEGVTAFIVPQKDSQISEEDIISLCKKELGGFEVPKKEVFLDEVQLTSTGKISKNILRETYQDIYK